jgi:hypothetical protein
MGLFLSYPTSVPVTVPLAPADVYFGRTREIQTQREMIKRRTMEQRRKQNQSLTHSTSINTGIAKSLS